MTPEAWALYCEAIHDTIVDGLERRAALIRWRRFVAATHKDTYTLETLDHWIVAGPYVRSDAWDHVERELEARC